MKNVNLRARSQKKEYCQMKQQSLSDLFRSAFFNNKSDEEDIMKKYLLLIAAVLMSLLVANPVMAQYGPGCWDDSGWYQGRGMGGGMMGGRGYG
jgi:hypothetical protein